MTTPGAATQWLATFHLPPRSLRLRVQTCVHCRNRPAHYCEPFANVFSEIKDPKTFDEGTDTSITYVGGVTHDIPKFEPNLSFSFNHRCHVEGRIGTGATIDILLDTGATKSYFSRKYYEEHPYLHDLPKYVPNLGPIRLGDGTLCTVDFIIPLIVTIENHVFEVFALITKMGNSELILGMKELMELEATIDTPTFTCNFLNRSPLIRPMKTCEIPVGKTLDVELECDYPDELSGAEVAKFLFYPSKVFDTAKVIVQRNKILLRIANKIDREIRMYPDLPVGILDICSLGYFRVNMEKMKNVILSRYKFTSMERACNEFNKMTHYVNHKIKA